MAMTAVFITIAMAANLAPPKIVTPNYCIAGSDTIVAEEMHVQLVTHDQRLKTNVQVKVTRDNPTSCVVPFFSLPPFLFPLPFLVVTWRSFPFPLPSPFPCGRLLEVWKLSRLAQSLVRNILLPAGFWRLYF